MLKEKDYRGFRVVPASPYTGGYVEGIHLSQVDEDVADDLRSALWEYGVLFVRRQNLTPEEMKRIALIYGDRLEQHTFGITLADEGHPEVVVVENAKSYKNYTDIWHHDVTSRKHPNIMSILQADIVPFGADTIWANMTAAFERMPVALKMMFLDISIDHDSLYMLLRHDYGQAFGEADKKVTREQEANTHPAVITHHVTGKPCLFVGNGYVKRVHQYPTEIGEHILKIANEYTKMPEMQVRYQWEKGDVAIWDNFQTVHYGVWVGNQPRRLCRVASWSPSVTPSQDRTRLGDLIRR